MTRLAVIGAGIMGSNHARVLGAIPGADVVAIVDPDAERGEALAKASGAEHFTSFSDVIGKVDAAVVASVSESHAQIGVPLLSAGIDLLIEKPIATSVEDGQALVDAAQANDRVLMIGHIERFNGAVIEAHRLVEDPLHIELTRMGPYSPRITSDIVLDLMIHDIDLAVSLAQSTVEDVHSVGRCIRSNSFDLVSALLRFANGVTATITASRVGQPKLRRIEMTQAENFVVVDMVRQDVTVHRVDHDEYLTEGGVRYRQTGIVEIPFLENRGEPLGLELRHFLACVEGRSEPQVGGEAGLRALELAIRIRDLAGSTN